MEHTKQNRPQVFRYSYGAIEAALIEVFNISESDAGAFRGRAKHLQRLNLVSGSGDGNRTSYDLGQARKWLIAMVLCSLEADPVLAVKTVNRQWDELTKQIAAATDEDAIAFNNHVMLMFHPALMAEKPLMTFRSIRVVHGAMAATEGSDTMVVVGGGPVQPSPPSHNLSQSPIAPAAESPIPFSAENFEDLKTILAAAKEGVCLRDLTDVLVRFDEALHKGVVYGRP